MSTQAVPSLDIPADFGYFVRDLIARKSFDPANYSLQIGSGDEMFYRAILPGFVNNDGLAFFKYFESALRIFDVYAQVAESLGGFSRLGPVLDFGSGWGRLTRSLVHRLPKENIWVSDIYPDAVAWQAETFGVNGLMSVSDPDLFPLKQQFSIVFAGSVFTHLPHDLFQRWLRKLYGLVLPHGILAFSVVEETGLQPGETIGSDGAGYFQRSESARLKHDIYGAMHVTEPYVSRSVAALDPSRTIGLRRYRRALYESQDLYLVAGSEVDLSELALIVTPLGGSTFVLRKGPSVMLGCWGIDLNAGHRLAEAEVFVGEQSIGLAELGGVYAEAESYFPAAPNAPVSWSLRVPELLPQREPLRVEMRSTAGVATLCYLTIPPEEAGSSATART
jgi:hypothetical protein